MKAIILAAGEGTRLRPYTEEKPKCMVEVDGESLLERQLDVLRNSSINDVIVIGGYMHNSLPNNQITKVVNKRYKTTNMVETLFSARNHLNGDLLVSYGDIVYSSEVLDLLMRSQGDINVVIDLSWESYWRKRSDDPIGDAESLKIDENGFICEIGQVPNSIGEIQGQYIGLVKYSSAGIDALIKAFDLATSRGALLRGKPAGRMYMTDLLQEIIDSGFKVNPVNINGGWVEVDTVSDLMLDETVVRLKSIKSNLR